MVLISCTTKRRTATARSFSNDCVLCNKPNILGCKCILKLHDAGGNANSTSQELLSNDTQSPRKKSIFYKLLTSSQSSGGQPRIGCIRYDDDCFSNKDVTYRFLQTRLDVKKSEYIIEVPVRENVRTNPPFDGSQSQGIIFSGLVFVNNFHPIILKNGKDDPVSHWQLGLTIRRGYCRNDFDVHISLSCVPSSGGGEESDVQFFVKLELQMLNHSGQVHAGRFMGEIQTVSEKIVAKYNFPHFVSLAQLQDEQLNLIEDSKTFFKIVLVYATGYHSNVGLCEMTTTNVENTSKAPIDSTDFSRNDVGIVTQNKYIMVKSKEIKTLCPLMAKEIKDNVILMETFSTRSVRRMINFLRTNKLQGNNFTFTSLEELIQLGHRYDIVNMKNLCFDMMIGKLTAETVARAIVLCMVYGAPQNVILKIKDFVFRHGTAMRRNEKTKFYADNFPMAFVWFLFGPLRRPVADHKIQDKPRHL